MIVQGYLKKIQIRVNLVLLVVSFLSGLSGCGYTLQTSRSPLFEREKVKTIYVQPVSNLSYKAGVENIVFNRILKALSQNHRVRIVSLASGADAQLVSEVLSAGYVPGATTSADQLYPANKITIPMNRDLRGISVASDYLATLNCHFRLERKVPEVNAPVKVIWQGTWTRSKSFPGNNQLGTFGTTSALLNESEFDRSLRDMSEMIANDVYESLFQAF